MDSKSSKETIKTKEKMKIKKKFKDKIFIEWIDACEVAGWKSFNDAIKIPEEVYCKTNGFIV